MKPAKSIIQFDSMDDELRNGLWNILSVSFWQKVQKGVLGSDHVPHDIKILLHRLWFSYFKHPLDTMPYGWPETLGKLREYFFKCKWNEVYDFIEFIANEYPDKDQIKPFIEYCNGMLEQEVSAYRFVGGKITQETSETEISEIEEALQSPLAPVKQHFNRALELFADRKAPDYRNSIKESISAVEALCRVIAKNDKATLGDALQEIGKLQNINLHPALKVAFVKLYGYTNDEKGIRHALNDQPNPDAEEAKFMLVSCSAFINYLSAKTKISKP